MAIHIADPEVSALMTEYAATTGMTKTEALRRLLKAALEAEKHQSRRARFRQVANSLVEKARREGQREQTKEEADAIF
ncbi:MAG: type II toxin-antitoxin system VapB family antitoxin [Acidobacteriaceae bacterium]|nr:type II toxin-antitoxin system VapB family antitoxin [Acidobacteriaceae bacterium]